MRPFWLVFALTFPVLAPLSVGCGDDDDTGGDGDADADGDGDGDADVPVGFGQACTSDEGCVEGVCFEETCSRTCEDYDQCPEGTICGHGDDRTICVAYSADEENVGVNCTNNEAACHAGTECRSRGPDDAHAFCSGGCESDRDCPKQWFCGIGPADENNEYCQPRVFCDACNVDDDCRFAEDDCIEGDDGLKFCSFVCDPDPASSSCPIDSVCREVTGHGYQCVPVAGGCTGDHTLCEPCRFDADCDDGPCLFDRRAAIRLCGQDCDEDPCPAGYDCIPIEGEEKPQCYPRVLAAGEAQTQACTRPSGGGRNCDPCVGHADCETGECITFATGNYCGQDCTVDDCGAWAECQDFANGQLHLCVPYNDITCGQYYRCTQDCDPETDECVEGDCG